MQESVERDFQAYGRPFDAVTYFKCMGQFLTAVDDDWPAVVGNLTKVWKSWERLSRILGQEGANMRVSGMFFKVVVQAVMLLG